MTDEEIERRVGDGSTVAALAAAAGVSRFAMRQRVMALGLETGQMRRRRLFREARRRGDTQVVAPCDKHGETTFELRDDRPSFRCLRCRSQDVSDARRRRKLLLIQEAGGCCIGCGYDAYPGALQFHHVDPETKSFGLARMGVPRSLAASRAEAAKCVLLCANCHAEVEGGVRVLSLDSVALPG